MWWRKKGQKTLIIDAQSVATRNGFDVDPGRVP
jgi:hypothetical protein